MKYIHFTVAIEILSEIAIFNTEILGNLKQHLTYSQKTEHCPVPLPSKDDVLAVLKNVVPKSKRNANRIESLRRYVEYGCPHPEWEINGYYNGSAECITTEPNYLAAKDQLKCYRENEPGTKFFSKKVTAKLYE